MKSVREHNHCRCDIDTNHSSAAFRCLGSQRSGSSCNIEQPSPVFNVYGLENWFDCPIGHCREGIVIAFGKLVVARFLEIAECFQVSL